MSDLTVESAASTARNTTWTCPATRSLSWARKSRLRPGREWLRCHSCLSRAFESQAAAYVIDVDTVLAPDHVTSMARKIIDEQSELQRN